MANADALFCCCVTSPKSSGIVESPVESFLLTVGFFVVGLIRCAAASDVGNIFCWPLKLFGCELPSFCSKFTNKGDDNAT